MPTFTFIKRISTHYFLFTLLLTCLLAVNLQGRSLSEESLSTYNQIKLFSLTGGKAEVSNLVLKRDRVEMTFSGTFYFTAPVEGKITGAVFIGQGKFRSEVPPNEFEKNNVQRLLNLEVIESDFKTAVLRFTDDTFDIIGKNKADGNAPEQVQKTATEFEERILKETGANISARLAVSLLNGEKPGFFFANFDGGKMNRFNFLMDYQNRIPTANFGVNAGEKGLIFAYQSTIFRSEIWTAFYSLEDYQNQIVSYSDTNDLVDIQHYKINVDIQNPKDKMILSSTVMMETRFPDTKAITFLIGESLSEYGSIRLKKQMRLKGVRSGSEILKAVQEDWEGGVTVFLPTKVDKNQKLELAFDFEGDFMGQPQSVNHAHYPISTTDWYPRHGYLDRSTFDFVFLHPKNLKIACVGTRTSEEIIKENKEIGVTKYSMKYPVALVTFALADFERHNETIKWENGKPSIPLEFNSLSGSYRAIKEDFSLAELNNSVRYFQAIFGDYPYDKYGATFHPFGFGQGFPSMLMIPNTDYANKYTFSFISHETAHQWWGNIVAWRSYRDQWLSEGFAEYSGVLYTALREKGNASRELIDEMRDSLKLPPRTTLGLGKGKLSDVGPIILGHRLNTTKTAGAYQTLIYNKGGLVLRMLHFLFTDPGSGNGEAFFTMMKDFVERHRNGVASTDDFRKVANEHFAKTSIAKKYGINDLNWFFSQWVYQAELPTYKLEYAIENQSDGSVIVSGNVIQQNAGEKWFMPMPLVFTFGNNQMATGSVAAFGEKNPFKIKLPMKPSKVELDPHKWVISEKTSTGSL